MDPLTYSNLLAFLAMKGRSKTVSCVSQSDGIVIHTFVNGNGNGRVQGTPCTNLQNKGYKNKSLHVKLSSFLSLSLNLLNLNRTFRMCNKRESKWGDLQTRHFFDPTWPGLE